MEKVQTRRNFIRTAGVAAAFSSISLSGWAEGFSALFKEGIHPSGEFSLLKLEKMLENYRLPAAGNFSENSFSLNYRLFNLYGDNAVPAGNMKWNLDPENGKRQFRFAVDRIAGNGIMDKSLSFVYSTEGKATCALNDEFTPEKWYVSKRIARNGEMDGFMGTGQTISGTFNHKKITLISGENKIVKQPGRFPLSWKWGVMAVVQHMARKNRQELQFSALDEFDALYAWQEIRFVKEVQLDCSGTHRPFKVFLQTGDGIIPTVFWVDDLYRTVFVLTGMEAFVLF